MKQVVQPRRQPLLTDTDREPSIWHPGTQQIQLCMLQCCLKLTLGLFICLQMLTPLNSLSPITAGLYFPSPFPFSFRYSLRKHQEGGRHGRSHRGEMQLETRQPQKLVQGRRRGSLGAGVYLATPSNDKERKQMAMFHQECAERGNPSDPCSSGKRKKI